MAISCFIFRSAWKLELPGTTLLESFLYIHEQPLLSAGMHSGGGRCYENQNQRGINCNLSKLWNWILGSYFKYFLKKSIQSWVHWGTGTDQDWIHEPGLCNCVIHGSPYIFLAVCLVHRSSQWARQPGVKALIAKATGERDCLPSTCWGMLPWWHNSAKEFTCKSCCHAAQQVYLLWFIWKWTGSGWTYTNPVDHDPVC